MAPLRAPAHLGTPGRALWRSIADPEGGWTLRPDELAVLERACRIVDRLADLDAELRKLSSWTTSGSMGQLVEHPVLLALGRHEALLARLLTSLKLPDLATGETSASARARHAAKVRWSKPRSS